MANILTPLDTIIKLVNDIKAQPHTGRRGSSIESAFDKIISNVNDAKNNIIIHLLGNNAEAHNTKNLPQTNTYAKIVQSNNTSRNKIIIPIDTKQPEKELIDSTEKKVISLLNQNNTKATIVNTSSTSKGNYVMKFTNDDNIDEIKDQLSKEFGEDIKVLKPAYPKIKIVSVPSSFDTSNKDEVINSIVSANDSLKNVYDSNNDCMKVIFSYDVNYGKTIILKCSPQIRNTLKILGDKIKIGYKLCPVYDRYHIFQCSKCCKFGHSAKSCKSPDTFCTFCSEEHSFKNCPKIENKEFHKCKNCLQSNNSKYIKSADTHHAFSSECPIKVSKQTFKSQSNKSNNETTIKT